MQHLVAEVFELAGALRRDGEATAKLAGQTEARWQVMWIAATGRPQRSDDRRRLDSLARASSASPTRSSPRATRPLSPTPTISVPLLTCTQRRPSLLDTINKQGRATQPPQRHHPRRGRDRPSYANLDPRTATHSATSQYWPPTTAPRRRGRTTACATPAERSRSAKNSRGPGPSRPRASTSAHRRADAGGARRTRSRRHGCAWIWHDDNSAPQSSARTGSHRRCVSRSSRSSHRSVPLCLDLPRAEEIRARLQPAAAAVAATRARALADPTRLLITLALREGQELCVCDLGWIAGRAENLVGHHLRVLREAGLATSRRDHKIVFYSLTNAGRELLDAHINLVQTIAT